MCRWLAYRGPSIYLEELVRTPRNSLIQQSRNACKAKAEVNADGFGIGWYGERAEPGLFRDVYPAWSDENLASLITNVRAPLFLAHVRASTGAKTSRANCHPFRYRNWLFMHNGQIGGFESVRRALEQGIDDTFYRLRSGTTDSELIFQLLLDNGLQDAPYTAFRQTVRIIEDVCQSNNVNAPLRLTASATNGKEIYAVRYASDARAPTLFAHLGGGADQTVLVSEPLDQKFGEWQEIEQNTFVETVPDGIRTKTLMDRP